MTLFVEDIAKRGRYPDAAISFETASGIPREIIIAKKLLSRKLTPQFTNMFPRHGAGGPTKLQRKSSAGSGDMN